MKYMAPFDSVISAQFGTNIYEIGMWNRPLFQRTQITLTDFQEKESFAVTCLHFVPHL